MPRAGQLGSSLGLKPCFASRIEAQAREATSRSWERRFLDSSARSALPSKLMGGVKFLAQREVEAQRKAGREAFLARDLLQKGCDLVMT